MEDFSLDDILKKGKGKPKSSKKKAGKGKEPTLGQSILEGIESYDEAMRDMHRPLTSKEKATIEALINATEICIPDPSDMFVLDKLIDSFQMTMEMAGDFASLPGIDEDDDHDDIPLDMLTDNTPGLKEIAFGLGMAYERLKSKGLI
ncbi:MAG: hypothetical protein SVM79_01535 [Chloroflexota bacterium]|nr:hypothetical protein [Chloroflexota bacterium]